MAGMQAMTVSTEVWVDPAQQTPYFLWGMGNTDAAGIGNGYVFSTGDRLPCGHRLRQLDYRTGRGTNSPLGRGSWRTLTYTVGRRQGDALPRRPPGRQQQRGHRHARLDR